MTPDELQHWFVHALRSVWQRFDSPPNCQSIHIDETPTLCTLSAVFSQPSADPSCPLRSVQVQLRVSSQLHDTPSDPCSEDSCSGVWPASPTRELDSVVWSLNG